MYFHNRVYGVKCGVNRRRSELEMVIRWNDELGLVHNKCAHGSGFVARLALMVIFLICYKYHFDRCMKPQYLTIILVCLFLIRFRQLFGAMSWKRYIVAICVNCGEIARKKRQSYTQKNEVTWVVQFRTRISK